MRWEIRPRACTNLLNRVFERLIYASTIAMCRGTAGTPSIRTIDDFWSGATHDRGAFARNSSHNFVAYLWTLGGTSRDPARITRRDG